MLQENIHTKINQILFFQMWERIFGQLYQWIVFGRLQKPMRSQEGEVERDRSARNVDSLKRSGGDRQPKLIFSNDYKKL